MSISIRSPRDFCAGLIFLFFGALAAYIARDYLMGSAVRMGPGYFDCEPAPLLLGFVLGPMMEENLRRALLLSRGAPTVFVTRPLSLALLVAAAALLVIVVVPAVRRKREEAFQE
jgi:putative tricarboxylic transport membrane protein